MAKYILKAFFLTTFPSTQKKMSKNLCCYTGVAPVKWKKIVLYSYTGVALIIVIKSFSSWDQDHIREYILYMNHKSTCVGQRERNRHRATVKPATRNGWKQQEDRQARQHQTVLNLDLGHASTITSQFDVLSLYLLLYTLQVNIKINQ